MSLLLGYGYGLLSYKFDLFPVPVIRFIKEYRQDDGVNTIGFRDTTGRSQVDCARFRDSAAVILTIGQSNSANHGETRYAPRHSVFNFNFFDAKCYRAADPLLGATGLGGSVWSRLGDLLVQDGAYQQVVIAPIGVNASSITQWQPDGDLNQRIQRALEGLRASQLELTHVLWHQGEADAMQSMTGATYRRYLEKLIENLRNARVQVPIYIAVTSMCHNPGSAQIRNAQIDVTASTPNVFPGANSDQLDRMAMRFDGCHFSDEGLRLHAELWRKALNRPVDE